ncbi:hypothetical protein Acid345_2000 [Candidatus Koribacter versatilis Ellin345]|uniref:Prepilin-type N-terminal cleavage/methylation domain-containing protein n=1 Tax=Koribacter versatilis (strain Ellin345) TaxID=204669 RepID=Q1IQ49_KORVE|nr:prepilin-type N-terminal cleavage/methylation domain-containing protein [Candidatus Koribacter versatilis]ABF41001.1 hypothetical protein Acid345_2000 [Candidatus Koribacter versatilis Ellin345]
MHVRRGERGFSMLELAIVVAITLIAGSIVFMSTREAIKNQRGERALQDMLGVTRSARQLAIDRRRVFKVAYGASPASITVTVTPATNSSGGCTAATSQWPDSPATANPPDKIDGFYDFLFVTGAPNSATTAPDGLGAGKTAGVNFTSTLDTTSVCFYPDGSARDSNNQYSSGLIYVAPTTAADPNTTSRLNSMRAMTIFGPTGRISGWKLSQTSSGLRWKQW